jgi:hypothetical protein
MRKLMIVAMCAAASLAWGAGDAGEHAGHDGPYRGAPEKSAKNWSSHPLLVVAGGAENGRGGKAFRLRGMAPETVRVVAPDGGERMFRVDNGMARIEAVSPKVGNYHWVIAREEHEGQVNIATTAWFVGNPGPSPTRLLARAFNELEIVPEPLPREHGSYRESEKWRFAIRFQGQPLAGQKVLLETENGSRVAFESDAQGVATVLFPRDFSGQADGGEHGRPKAAFVLSTEHEDGGRHYATSFNLSYSPDGDRGRSVAWGAFFGLAGMVCAAPLLRRRKNDEPANGGESC